jgi:hypothetical protein
MTMLKKKREDDGFEELIEVARFTWDVVVR